MFPSPYKLLTSVLLVLPVAAPAATLTLDDLLGTFNAVTQSYSGTQEIEGRTYIDGDLSNITGQFGFKTANDGASFSELYVNGDIISSTINLTSGSLAEAAGSLVNSTVNNGTLIEGSTALPEIDFAALQAESLFLASLTGTAADVSDQNNKVFGGPSNAVEGEANFGTDTTILNVDLLDLNGGGYSLDVSSLGTLIINVSGTSGTFNTNPLGGINGAENTIWNFFEATDVQFNSVVQGHVFAPNATLSGFSGSAEGTIISSSLVLTNGELHQRSWNGVVATAIENEVAAVPLPAGLPLLLAGLSGLWMVRRQT